ncbi:MAG: DNA repair protein RecO [Coriobacteriales bacterium]|jgi:DNA repair protein RecO (recombination protein O)|nr:DNA repair protein RecO [Coriobacteriales bacterium]
MTSYSAQGLVLKKTKLGETDLIITLLAATGHQIRAVAKGARKPGSQTASRLELFSLVDLLLHQGRSLDVVTEVRLVEANRECRAEPERMASAAVLCEFLETVTREADVEPRLYPMACEALRFVGSVAPEGLSMMLAAALFKFAGQIGYLPAVGECALCGMPAAACENDEECYRWLVFEGGLVCHECSESQNLNFELDQQDAGFSTLSAGSGLYDKDRHEKPPHDNARYDKDRSEAISPEESWVSAALLGWLQMCIAARFKDIEKAINENSSAQSKTNIAALGTTLLGFAQEWIESHLSLRLKSMKFLRDFLPK